MLGVQSRVAGLVAMSVARSGPGRGLGLGEWSEGITQVVVANESLRSGTSGDW